MSTLSADEALQALNELRSNMIATQSASWSNLAYPLVAILNAAGLDQFDSGEEQMRQHMDCYGGAGGFPGSLKDEGNVRDSWVKPASQLQSIIEMARRVISDPSEENLGYLRHRLPEEEA